MKREDVIIKPIITEKSMQDATAGKFTFKVLKAADKKTIKRAVEEKFKVNVLDISTLIIKGKKRRAGVRRVEVLQSPYKKAVVTLKPGQKIDLFDMAQSQS